MTPTGAITKATKLTKPTKLKVSGISTFLKAFFVIVGFVAFVN